MSGAPVNFDRIIPEETQGPMPVEAPTTLASGSMDSFQHVEAVLKEDNVSTGTLDSQDWEMVTEMVEDTDNAATHFLQGKHVIDLEGPAPNLQESIDKMMATMEKMKLGSTADGVEAPSRSEGVASAAAVPSGDAAPMDDMVVEQTTHKWKVFGRGTSSPTFILAEVPFSMEAVTKDIKQMVEKLSTEEIFDLFVKFCDSESIPAVSFGRVIKAYVAMKAQKVHDEVMKQPHVAGRSRPGVGSDSLRENTQPEPIATHQCPECFTDWATQWDPSQEKMCVCGKKVLPIRKTKHLVNMDHTRLVQIIGRNRGKKASLQLIMDEPPEALYNQWIKDRIEYYKRVEPVAPPRDEQLDLGPPVARLRVSHSNDRGAVGQMIWASILSNRELSNLQYIGKVADKHARRARSSEDATIA